MLLLKECENQTGILRCISSCLKDERHQSYIDHSYEDMLTQRVLQIAAGYEDANDCNTLRNDNIFKLCSNKLPQDGALASQPTMSRFENKPSRSEQYRIAEAFVNQFLQSYTEEPQYIILDCDDTNSNIYGEQQLSLCNDYYGEYCYMPLHIYEGVSGKLITTILKPGRRSKNTNVFAILSRLIVKLRGCWKHTMIIVRGDGHFCNQQLMDWCSDKKGVHLLTGLTGNKALNKLADITIESAKRQYVQTQKPVKRYHSFEYQAASSKQSQRVIVKVEANDKGTNIRYIVTDIRAVRTTIIRSRLLCKRGYGTAHKRA